MAYDKKTVKSGGAKKKMGVKRMGSAKKTMGRTGTPSVGKKR